MVFVVSRYLDFQTWSRNNRYHLKDNDLIANFAVRVIQTRKSYLSDRDSFLLLQSRTWPPSSLYVASSASDNAKLRVSDCASGSKPSWNDQSASLVNPMYANKLNREMSVDLSRYASRVGDERNRENSSCLRSMIDIFSIGHSGCFDKLTLKQYRMMSKHNVVPHDIKTQSLTCDEASSFDAEGCSHSSPSSSHGHLQMILRMRMKYLTRNHSTTLLVDVDDRDL